MAITHDNKSLVQDLPMVLYLIRDIREYHLFPLLIFLYLVPLFIFFVLFILNTTAQVSAHTLATAVGYDEVGTTVAHIKIGGSGLGAVGLGAIGIPIAIGTGTIGIP